MSVSMYRGQVDRLTKEIADLERKRADEGSRATREREAARRASASLTARTSESTRRSKLGEISRHEAKAADHDKKAAKCSADIASKQRSLTTAKTNLERALKQADQKQAAEARRQRERDRQHLRDLERARRAVQHNPWTPPSAYPDVQIQRVTVAQSEKDYEYDVCLSFAGEDRAYVEMVARALKEKEIRVFYDEDEEAVLWGKDLAEYFDWVYRVASRYCLMFISSHYASKPWTRHERRSALARAMEEEAEYVLPARFDATQLPGLRPTVKYIELSQLAPETLAEFVVEKLQSTPPSTK